MASLSANWRRARDVARRLGQGSRASGHDKHKALVEQPEGRSRDESRIREKIALRSLAAMTRQVGSDELITRSTPAPRRP